MASSPSRSWPWVALKASLDSLLAVSSIVPSAKISLRSATVLYEFSLVPQHIPLALLAAIPPIIAESIEAGSGPIFLPYFARNVLA